MPGTGNRGEQEADGSPLRGRLAALQLASLQRRFPRRRVLAVFMLLNGFATIASLAGLAMLTRTSFVFPSLGPTW